VHWNCESVKKSWGPNRVISKVRKIQQHQKALSTLRKPSVLLVHRASFILSFLFLERLHCIAATYIFTAPKCTTTIISLEHCALNAGYQHFILRRRLIKNVFYFAADTITEKRGIGGERRPKDKGEDRVTSLRITLIFVQPTNTLLQHLWQKQLTQTQHPKIHSNLFLCPLHPSSTSKKANETR
jgi:hypothetical protein